MLSEKLKKSLVNALAHSVYRPLLITAGDIFSLVSYHLLSIMETAWQFSSNLKTYSDFISHETWTVVEVVVRLLNLMKGFDLFHLLEHVCSQLNYRILTHFLHILQENTFLFLSSHI